MLHVTCYGLRDQEGQTLIETIIAIFLLTMALSAGLGLAVYALSASSTTFNQITATNLSREGVEVARMMRDSNWLASDVKGGPWDLAVCADIGSRLCFPRAFLAAPPYNNFDLGVGNYRAQYDLASRVWLLQTVADYNLYTQANGSFSHTANGASAFARMIKISQNTAAPYTAQNSNWELIVKSIVAWRGKNCPNFASSSDLETLTSKCKIVVEEHLTNWKDYK